MGEPASVTLPAADPLAGWLTEALGDPGAFRLRRLTGGNSNETLLLDSPSARRVLRRPPPAAISASAHSMAREHRILGVLAATDVPVPRPLAFCDDPAVVPAPVLVMEYLKGYGLTDTLPPAYPDGVETVAAIGQAAIDALAGLHRLDWETLDLAGFGRPDGFLERQVTRWRSQYESYAVRELPAFEAVAGWLADHRPPTSAPAIIHGDFHLDNCLVGPLAPPRIVGIVDWEMATIGDPLLDVGLFLALWGSQRPAAPAVPRIQAVSRVPGAPTREALAERYARATGRDLGDLRFYLVLALWKLGTIIEGAYAQLVHGQADSPYARALAADVPRLFAEAAAHAGLTS